MPFEASFVFVAALAVSQLHVVIVITRASIVVLVIEKHALGLRTLARVRLRVVVRFAPLVREAWTCLRAAAPKSCVTSCVRAALELR